MIARVIALAGLIVSQTSVGGDERSELKLTAPHRQPQGPAWFVISAAARKRVLVAIKDAKIASFDVSAEFPYSVSFYESPTNRYSAVLVFSDRAKDALIDSFGITARGELQRTDDDTHQQLIDCAAEGRALGEKIGKQIWGDHH